MTPVLTLIVDAKLRSHDHCFALVQFIITWLQLFVFIYSGNQRHTNGHKNSPLNYLKFSVFGLGSSAYPNFCAFSQLIDKTMESLGATRIYSIGEGDELCGQEEAFKTWAKKIYQVISAKGKNAFKFCVSQKHLRFSK